jgi:hypothetical protein
MEDVTYNPEKKQWSLWIWPSSAIGDDWFTHCCSGGIFRTGNGKEEEDVEINLKKPRANWENSHFSAACLFLTSKLNILLLN